MIADNFNKQDDILRSKLTISGYRFPEIGLLSFEELQQFVKGKQAIKDMLAIQGSLGNWNTGEYMRGLYNGLVLAGIEFGLSTTDDLKSWE